MKGFVIGLVATAIICLAITVATGNAANSRIGHTSTLTVTEECNKVTGKRDLSWVVTPTNQNLSPKISASTRAAIAVGSSVPFSFPESIDGSSGNVSAGITVKWSDNYSVQLQTSTHFEGTCTPPVVNCPEGTVKDATSTATVLVCIKTNTITNTVTVNHDVPGPTQYVTQYVDKIVTVTKDVPGPTVTVTKVEFKTKIVNHTKVKTKIVYRTKQVIVRVCPISPKQPALAG